MIEGVLFEISPSLVLQTETAIAAYIGFLDEIGRKRWVALHACVQRAAQSNEGKDLVELDIAMLRLGEAAADDSSSSEEDDEDDERPVPSPVRRSPRSRTKSMKAREAAGTNEIKEKLSDKFLPFDAKKHKDWHVSVSRLPI